MSWHYAPGRRFVERLEGDPEFEWTVHEIYDVNGETMWTEDAVEPYGETFEELTTVLNRMLSDLALHADQFIDLDRGEVVPRVD